MLWYIGFNIQGCMAQLRTRFKRLLHMACYMRLYKFFFHSTILIGIGTALKQALYQLKKIIYKRAACRSDSRIRHLFAEQDTHIALADGQTSDSRIRPTRMMLPNCFYFVRLFFWIGIRQTTCPSRLGRWRCPPRAAATRFYSAPGRCRSRRHAARRWQS